MSEIDDFAVGLLEESKRFYEKMRESSDDIATAAYAHAALMLGFCSLEAHVNSICDDFCDRSDVTIHERSVLLEQELRMENGEFKLKGLKMVRLDERIQFLHARFSGKPINKSETWWSSLGAAITLRNQLTHPKSIPSISESSVGNAIVAIIETIDALYRAIYGRPFPVANRGLQSKHEF